MQDESLSNLWKRYAESYFLFTPYFQETLLKNVGKEMYGNVLDAGCGVGKLISRINDYSSYVGIDSNSEMIEVAKNKLVNKLDVSLEMGDVCNINYSNNYFDSVASINVLYALNSPLVFLEEVRRVLKPEGKFILASPNKSLNMGFLEKKLIEEFGSSSNEEVKKQFKVYLEVNDKLATGISKTEYRPKLFDEDEIEKILFKIGFRVIKKEKAYLDQLFHITSVKI